MLEVFFALLRDALWASESEQLPNSLTGREVESVLSFAEKQAVSGLIIDTIFRNDMRMPQDALFECVGLWEQIKQQNREVNTGVKSLDYLFLENKIDYIIVKGQAVASYYPQSLLRQSGDIDYYCYSNFESANNAIRKTWGIEPERGSSSKHIHFEYKGLTFEGHFKLANLYNKKCNTYFSKLLKGDRGANVVIDGCQVKTLSPTLHVLFVFLHFYDHLLSLGVGLRQFCDLAVMLRYAQKQIDINALRVHLETLGVERAYRACGSILVEELGLHEADLGYALTENDLKYGRRILDVVMYRGNMGHYEGSWMREEGRRKRKMKAIGIKLSHFFKFAPLAPSYACSWLWFEIKRNL